MKKVLNKKILFGIITTLLLFTSVNFVSANWTGKSDCITKVEEVENKDLYGIANYNYDLVTSKLNGVSDEIERKTYWVETQNWGNDVRLVNWTNSVNVEDWKGTTMTDLARQFERENPGWNVIAGINGDFFHISASGGYPANCEPVNGSYLLSDCNVLILTMKSTYGYLAKHRCEAVHNSIAPGAYKKLKKSPSS